MDRPEDRGVTDCGPDGGCEECDVCRYLSFLEWAGAVGKPDGSTIERDERVEAYLRRTYPHVPTPSSSSQTPHQGEQ